MFCYRSDLKIVKTYDFYTIFDWNLFFSSAPPYHAHHTVQEAGWNYVDGDDVNGRQEENKLNVDGESVKKEHLIDLASNPPPYQANKVKTG